MLKLNEKGDKMKIIIVLITLLLVTSCTKKECIGATIETVGGCDKYGYCGVKYTDNTYGTQYFPVIGKTVCK